MLNVSLPEAPPWMLIIAAIAMLLQSAATLWPAPPWLTPAECLAACNGEVAEFERDLCTCAPRPPKTPPPADPTPALRWSIPSS